MRINLSVTPEEFETLQRVSEHQAKLIPGFKPTITGVAKTCMISGLNDAVKKIDDEEAMEKAKRKR